MDYDRFVAVGWHAKGDAALLATSFEKLWPLDEAPCFGGLLAAIDKADRHETHKRQPTSN